MPVLVSGRSNWMFREIFAAEDFDHRRNEADVLLLPGSGNSRYVTGFACSDRCVEEALGLRYDVFNLELGEGLDESVWTGLDRDPFDSQMTHLVVLDNTSGRVVGTYRLQTAAQALEGSGFYSAREYDLTPLEPFFPELVEAGRACIARDHRSLGALMALWLGIGAFMNLHGSRYLFGCCSLTSRDPDDGWRALKTLRAKGHLHPIHELTTREPFRCGANSREFSPDLGPSIPPPKLFGIYMQLGAWVISEPAIDREFGTVDFLVLLDGKRVKFSPLDVLR